MMGPEAGGRSAPRTGARRPAPPAFAPLWAAWRSPFFSGPVGFCELSSLPMYKAYSEPPSLLTTFCITVRQTRGQIWPEFFRVYRTALRDFFQVLFRSKSAEAPEIKGDRGVLCECGRGR